MKRCATDFLETLYRRNREALHLIVDEADTFAPQRVMGDDAQLLGAMEDIAKKGRIRGLGCTVLTQRTAVLNKNVLTQCESIFAMRLTHPKDIAAIREWIGVHATEEDGNEVIKSLPTLRVGDAWFWSPAWMSKLLLMRVRMKETFDSSRTPKPGERRIVPKVVAPVDLEKLTTDIRSLAEQAKANDPKTLKAEIARLTKELAKKPGAAPATSSAPSEAAIQRIVAKAVSARDAEWKPRFTALEKANAGLAATISKAAKILGNPVGDDMTTKMRPKMEPMPKPVITPEQWGRDFEAKGIETPASKSRLMPSAETGDATIPKGEKAILSACAQHGECDRPQLTVLTGYKRSSRDAYVSRLREKGYVESRGDSVVATQAGIDALGTDYEPLPTGAELREYTLTRLPEGERRCLEVAIEAYPNGVNRDTISEATGYKRSSRDAYVQRLSARKLVMTDRGVVTASANLF